MEWGCPHCGTRLEIQDVKLSSGWSFSKCFKCGGFALIRKAEINVIKVDKAPPGEPILLPEFSANPAVALLGEQASKVLQERLQAPKSISPPLPPVDLPFIAAENQERLQKLEANRKGSSLMQAALTAILFMSISSGYFYLYFYKKPKTKIYSDQIEQAAFAPSAVIKDTKFQATALQDILLRNGPGDQFDAARVFNEGQSSSVLQVVENWVQLQNPSGWVKEEHVKLDPIFD